MNEYGSYEDILDKMRKRIPDLTGEWTNYNLHDPGWMILELFAFLLDVLRYRICLIGEKQKWKYLELLGFSRCPVKAARAVLQIRADKPRILPPRTRIWAEDICFETENSRLIMEGDIAACLFCREGKWRKADRAWLQGTESMPIHIFDRQPVSGSCFYLVFDRPLPVREEILLYADILELEKIRRNPIGEQGEFVPLVRLEYAVYAKSGYINASYEDDTYGFLQDGWIRLKFYSEMEYMKKTEGILQTEGYYLRIRLLGGNYDIPPVLERITANAVSVRQRYHLAWLSRQKSTEGNPHYLFREEQGALRLIENMECSGDDIWRLEYEIREKNFPLAGIGRGDSEQVYPLPPYQLEEEGFQIIVETGKETGMFEPWEKVYDFCSSLPGDPHYILAQEEGCLKFGDGIRGKAPEGRIFISHCAGCEGSRGNVSSRTICRMEDPADELKVWNCQPAKGGKDGERLEECIERYKEWEKQGEELVSLRDYEEAVLKTPGLIIGQCRAIPMENGEGEKLRLVVRPGSGRRLSEEYKKNILHYMEKRRLLGTSLLLCEPVYVGLTVYLRWRGRENGKGIEKIRKVLEDYLEVFCEEFGGRLRTGKITGLAEKLEEVDQVTEVLLEPSGSGAGRLPGGDVELWPHALLNQDKLNFHIHREG